MNQKLEGHTDTVVGVSVHPKQNMIASCALAADATIRVWVDSSTQASRVYVSLPLARALAYTIAY